MAVLGGEVSARTSEPADQESAPACLGRLTIPGQARAVARARAYVASALGAHHPCTDVAVLLTSELATNAVLHSRSRREGGTVTIVVSELSGEVRVEVSDDGSTRTPVVKDEVYTSEGHGLFLVEQLADQWGYLRDCGRTTVWFCLGC
ncbi:MAG TPA: ATP-binding protein [Streptosporangiaceae bacterium]|jgi:anti-sigma regulatory factor (Ser/Thr protein kinase)|nr:ATP-binding protein [Streptosporangiaceae bacterium]